MTEQPTLADPPDDHADQPWTARATLPADPGASVAARRLVSTLFLAWGLHDQVEVAELVVSELVSNAVRHAGDSGDLELELLVQDDSVRLSVADGSPDYPVLRSAAERSGPGNQPGGLGLHLVDRVAQRWGVEDYLFGKRVWVLLTTTEPSRGPTAIPMASQA
jgi:anti-sigma regulatory factor (Ser/Thr protein kinase)